MTPEEKNFQKIANAVENYFDNLGFYTIIKDTNLRVIKMEHEDGRDVVLTTNYSALDFHINGYSFLIK